MGLAGDPVVYPSFSPEAARVIHDLGSGVERLWIDEMCQAHINDDSIIRVSTQGVLCLVTSAGLTCGGQVVTPPSLAGHVIDGGMSSLMEYAMPCWLTDAGVVSCGTVGNELFPGRVARAIALNPYSLPTGFPDASLPWIPSVCAVMDDGSVWCIGNNSFGRLGSGEEDSLLEATEVQPPGSASLGCP
jgi:hypothetical protein